MTVYTSSGARHRAPGRPTTPLSSVGQDLTTTARRGILAAASSTLAVTMAATTASAAPNSSSSAVPNVEIAALAQQARSAVTTAPVTVPANATWELDDVAEAKATPPPEPEPEPEPPAEVEPAVDRTTAAASRGSARTESTSQQATRDGGTHVVRAGDTVAKLAHAYGTSVSAIIAANNLDSRALIHVGDRLTISDEASASRSASRSASPQPAPAQQAAPQQSQARSAPRQQSSAPQASKASAPASSASGVVSIAYQYIGTPYVWGGATPAGFDCSGFTSYVYAQAGISIPRTSGAQRHAGTQVSASAAQPGDLVWWPGHVGIYVGGGQYIAAHSPGTPLSVRAIYKANPTYIRVG